MIKPTREDRRQLYSDNLQFGGSLTPIEECDWHPAFRDSPVVAVWRSRHYLVQQFPCDNPGVRCRLTVARTKVTGDRFSDNIPWEDLQRIKDECGFAECDAVEVFPASADVVNVANLRHLWILEEPLPFAWRTK